MRLLRSLSVLGLLVPGLLAVPVLTLPAAASPVPVAPVVQELDVAGIDETAAESSAPSGVTGALVTGGDRRTVLLTDLLDTKPFSMVGITWDGSSAVEEVQAWVRTRTAGTWSGWKALGGTADEEPDLGTLDAAGATRGGTSPLWVGDADGVQARVDVLSGPDPKGLRLSLVDPGESPADGMGAAGGALSVADAASSAPAIRSRAEWGADESLRRGSPSYAAVQAVTLHHTASSNDYSAADVPRLLRGFYAYHVKAQGWSDIGYNFLVDRFGTVWEGRAGGISRGVIGAHAGGFNTGTVGISMIGTYDAAAPTSAALESVAQLTAWRLSLAGVDPRGSVRLSSGGSTRFSAGTPVTLPRVFGHRDVSTTACPGAQGMAALPGIRSRAAALAGGAAPTPSGPVSLEVVAPTAAAAGASVALTVTGGPAGQPVEVWFSKRGDDGFTKRRDAVLSASGSYRTTFTADDDYTYFAVAGGEASPRRSTRTSPAPTSAPKPVEPVLRVQGPVTAPAGSPVLVTASGPAGAGITVWFRREGETAFVKRRTGVLDAAGRYTTTYTADVPHEYVVMSSTVTSNDATTLVGEVPNGLDITAPAGVDPGVPVDVVVQGEPGEQVEVWFARRGESGYTRRRAAALAPDGTFRTTFVANDEYSYFAVSGDRTSKRVRTRVSRLPALVTAPAPRLQVASPAAVDAGESVPITVTGTAGAPVDLWFRRRGTEVWSRLREGRFDAAGRWSTSYAGVDDHEYWASSGGVTSGDAATLTVPVLTGPRRAPLGAKVELSGRARPGDSVVVERRRRGSTTFSKATLTADRYGAFRTSLALDDEYEYRPVAASRVGTLHRTTVAPTVTAASAVPRGTPVTISGTARPGATVSVLFRRDGAPSLAVGGRRDRDLPTFRVGRTVTAGPDGRWATSFAPVVQHRWYARSDGNVTPVRTTTVR